MIVIVQYLNGKLPFTSDWKGWNPKDAALAILAQPNIKSVEFYCNQTENLGSLTIHRRISCVRGVKSGYSFDEIAWMGDWTDISEQVTCTRDPIGQAMELFK